MSPPPSNKNPAVAFDLATLAQRNRPRGVSVLSPTSVTPGPNHCRPTGMLLAAIEQPVRLAYELDELLV